MRWPWAKGNVETRAAYTDQVTAALYAAATGDGAIGIGSTATEESCRGLWMRAFAQAELWNLKNRQLHGRLPRLSWR